MLIVKTEKTYASTFSIVVCPYDNHYEIDLPVTADFYCTEKDWDLTPITRNLVIGTSDGKWFVQKGIGPYAISLR